MLLQPQGSQLQVGASRAGSAPFTYFHAGSPSSPQLPLEHPLLRPRPGQNLVLVFFLLNIVVKAPPRVSPPLQAGLSEASKAVSGVVDPSAIKKAAATTEAAVNTAKPAVEQVRATALAWLAGSLVVARGHG